MKFAVPLPSSLLKLTIKKRMPKLMKRTPNLKGDCQTCKKSERLNFDKKYAPYAHALSRSIVMFSHGRTFPRVTASGCRVTGDG